MFQQQRRRVYAQGRRRQAKQKADQNKYCRRCQHQIKSITGYDEGDSNATKEAETQDLISLRADVEAPRAEKNGTEFV